MWFDTWSGLLRVVLVGSAAYLWLVLVLRVSGKRTLAKLNAFDLVITVALGSTMATILLDSAVAWSDGATALTVLVLAQFCVAFLTSRFRSLRAVVTAGPTLLVHDGELLHGNVRRQRVAEAEIRQSLRSAGVGGLDAVAAVVLETDGTLSVIPSAEAGDGWAIQDVAGNGEDTRGAA